MILLGDGDGDLSVLAKKYTYNNSFLEFCKLGEKRWRRNEDKNFPGVKEARRAEKQSFSAESANHNGNEI